MRVPQQDDRFPHQIRLSFDERNRVNVSCNCRRVAAEGEPTEKQRAAGLPRGGQPHYESFGIPANTREAKALYNDLTKHDQSRAPFTVEHLLEER